mgnify:CR=1 FL=1
MNKGGLHKIVKEMKNLYKLVKFKNKETGLLYVSLKHYFVGM